MCSCKKVTILMTEIFKTIHDENPQFMRDVILSEDTRYDVRSELSASCKLWYVWTTLGKFRGSQL